MIFFPILPKILEKTFVANLKPKILAYYKSKSVLKKKITIELV